MKEMKKLAGQFEKVNKTSHQNEIKNENEWKIQLFYNLAC